MLHCHVATEQMNQTLASERGSFAIFSIYQSRGRLREGIFSWLQSATSPLDVTKLQFTVEKLLLWRQRSYSWISLPIYLLCQAHKHKFIGI